MQRQGESDRGGRVGVVVPAMVLSRALAGWLWMQMLVHRWLWQQRLVSGAAASSLLLLVAVAPAPPRGGIVNKRFG